MSNPGPIGTVVDFMRERQIAIADGHHRYETSLAYRDEVRRNLGYNGDECCELPSDYTLMTLMNVYQAGLTIFPTHRVVGSVPEDALRDFDQRLQESFEVKASSPRELTSDMRERRAIGMYRKNDARTLTPKPEARTRTGGSEAARELELNALHGLVLEPLLGIDAERLRNQTHIVYTRDADEAMRLVDSGERQMAFLLNHIDVKSVLDIASAGEKMPQKATYFYPKLLSGLVLRRMA